MAITTGEIGIGFVTVATCLLADFGAEDFDDAEELAGFLPEVETDATVEVIFDFLMLLAISLSRSRLAVFILSSFSLLSNSAAYVRIVSKLRTANACLLHSLCVSMFSMPEMN